MGFEKIYLIGVDFDYDSGHGPVKHFYKDELIENEKRDFSRKEQLTNAYKKINRLFGDRVCNATIGGELDLIPRIDYNSLFKL